MPYKGLAQLEYMREYRKRMPEAVKLKARLRVRARNKEVREETRAWLQEYKKTLCCSRCPEKRAPCLDFHHVGEDKVVAVSAGCSRTWKKEKLLAEIKKCIVLCANCHRVEHSPLAQR